MWIAVQITVFAVFLVIIAFVVGKGFGQRRFSRLQEEMQALELSFKHLLEDMEMVSDHNMKVLEASSADLKELLNVADKKCLYAYDLLNEIDEGIKDVKKRNLNNAGITPIDSVAERKFRKEMHEALEEVVKKMQSLSQRLGELEEDFDKRFPETDFAELIQLEVSRQLEEMQSHLDFSSDIAEAGEVYAAGEAEEAVPARVSGEKVVAIKPSREGFSSGNMAEKTLSATSSQVATKLKKVSIDESVRFPAAVKKTDLQAPAALPPMGFHIKEVLDMVEQGVTLPQIARTLKMGKGEIELILKIYGERADMRKIM